MKKEHAFDDLSVTDLPISGRTLNFGNDIMLADNLDEPLEEGEASRFIMTPYPFKLNFTMALFCLRGNMRIRLNLTEYELRERDVLIVLPGAIGECLTFPQDCQVALLVFSDDAPANGMEATLTIMFRKYLSQHPIIHLSQEDIQDMMSLYHLMRHCITRSDNQFTREMLASYTQILCYNGYQWLTEHAKELQEEEKQDRAHMIFSRFISLVGKHYAIERRISFYADKMYFTPKYLATMVYQASGRHAGEWIKDYVILEAKALLRSRKYTAQQVSDLLNFPNASFFGKYFKAAVGCTPKEYIKQ